MAKDKEADKKDKKDAEPAEDTVEGEGAPKPKRFGKKAIILAVVGLLVVLGGAGAGLYMAGVIGPKKHATEEQAAEGAEGGGHGETANKKPGGTVFFTLGDILVNLSGEGKRPNFLKMKVSLELADAKDIPMMEAIRPRIVDNFQVYLRELRIEDLRGSAGLYRLREELLLRVTEAAQPIRVKDVLFQEMLVQ